jgi:hypothetical protein
LLEKEQRGQGPWTVQRCRKKYHFNWLELKQFVWTLLCGILQ